MIPAERQPAAPGPAWRSTPARTPTPPCNRTRTRRRPTHATHRRRRLLGHSSERDTRPQQRQDRTISLPRKWNNDRVSRDAPERVRTVRVLRARSPTLAGELDLPPLVVGRREVGGGHLAGVEQRRAVRELLQPGAVRPARRKIVRKAPVIPAAARVIRAVGLPDGRMRMRGPVRSGSSPWKTAPRTRWRRPERHTQPGPCTGPASLDLLIASGPRTGRSPWAARTRRPAAAYRRGRAMGEREGWDGGQDFGEFEDSGGFGGSAGRAGGW